MHYYPLGVLAVSWVFWLWENYLSFRQYRVYQTTDKVPKELKGKINEETFSRAKAYGIDKAIFGFISGIFSQVQTTIIICYYLIPYFWDLSNALMTETLGFNRSGSIEWEIFQSLTFTLVTSTVSTLIDLPLSIYNTFVIEERHGFNKQTAGFYAWDKLKAFFVSFTISAPITAATVFIVRNGGPYFFLYLWMFCFVVVCVLTFFHGEIAAIFDKFSPLPEGDLRNKIEKLSASINFPLTNIFVVEGSKRSAHSNAYQSGIFNRKRIVIYDTLIEGYYDGKDDLDKSVSKADKSKEKKGCDHDEILAILCHELGHWYCGHLIKYLTFAQVNYFFMFLIFSKFYNDSSFYAAFGLVNEMPVIIGFALLMMVLTPYNELLGYFATAMTRRFEYQADNFAKIKGYAKNLKTGLIKLHVDNLGFPVYDELYSMFNHSHPTLMQRLKGLSKSE